MKLKVAFSTATAMIVLMTAGAALADDNNIATIVQTGADNTGHADQTGSTGGIYAGSTTIFTQTGDHNSADVTQSGSGNEAGTHLNTTDTYGVMYQHGDYNSIIVTQTGGDSVANSAGSGGNLLQKSNHNTANISQKGSADVVGNVVQTGNTNGNSLKNELTITQSNAASPLYAPAVPTGSSDYNYGDQWIYSVLQTNTSGTAANHLTLTQKNGVFGLGDVIVSVVQNGSDNLGTVTQDGRTNYLGSLSQTGASNTATVLLTGTSNGKGPAGGPFTSAVALGVSGVTQAAVTQTGDSDIASYTANGDDNLYGITQQSLVGTGHNTATGTVNGSSNETAIGQSGIGNVTTFTQGGDTNALGVSITGDDNGVGSFRGASSIIGVTNGNIAQSGGSNSASITISGDDANYGATQNGGNNILQVSLTNGDDNNFAIIQSGSDQAHVSVTGKQNVLGVQQLGAGTNSLEATITGDSNNWSGSLSGEAGTLGLTAGSIYQNNNGGGANNDVNLMVLGSSNLFAVKQQGSNNHVTGTVTSGGTGNQAAVLQLGSTNTATYTQTGSDNNVGISQ